jgi:hypothetical protein
VEELETARGAALDELAAACLPELTREAIARAGKELRYGRFAKEDPFEQLERRRANLDGQIRNIEADERYVRREALLDPVTGELTLALQKATDDLKQLQGPLDRYESERRFRELIACGYDTESYRVSRWSLQYYRDWKWGDIYCERFAQERFSQVREAYFNIRSAYVEIRRDVDRIQREIADVEGLSARLDAAKRDLEHVQEDTLRSCQGLVREHLEHLDRRQLADWLAADPVRVTLVKRVSGIEHKRDYLQELAARQFGTEAEVIDRSSAKLRRKIAKYGRAKNFSARIAADEAASWLADPTPKLESRRDRFRRDYDTVATFDRYDAYDFARDLLWWDLMTDGRVDGGFIPEVSAWRGAHPTSDEGLASASTAFSSAGDEAGLHEVS